MNKITHLRGLQAFDAAATYSNLSMAADYLGVTHGAVSRQIKQLEEYFGVTLFNRKPGGVEKTEAGERLHLATQRAFSLLESGLNDIQRPRDNRSLRISLPSSLAVKWLVTKLGHFRAKHPGISVYLDTDDKIIDFHNNKADVALRYSSKEDKDLFQKLILDEVSYVVASPNLVAKYDLPMKPEEIAQLPLLYDDFNSGWREWAKQVRIKESLLSKSALELKDSAVLITSAIEGQGVALARAILLEEDLKSGRLVRLDEGEVALSNSLYFVCRKGNEQNHAIRVFLDWILSLYDSNNQNSKPVSK